MMLGVAVPGDGSGLRGSRFCVAKAGTPSPTASSPVHTAPMINFRRKEGILPNLKGFHPRYGDGPAATLRPSLRGVCLHAGGVVPDRPWHLVRSLARSVPVC